MISQEWLKACRHALKGILQPWSGGSHSPSLWVPSLVPDLTAQPPTVNSYSCLLLSVSLSLLGFPCFYQPEGATVRHESVCGCFPITLAAGKQNHYDASLAEPGSGPTIPQHLGLCRVAEGLLCAGPAQLENACPPIQCRARRNPSQAESGLKDWLHGGKLSIVSCTVHSTSDKGDQPRVTPISLRAAEWHRLIHSSKRVC